MVEDPSIAKYKELVHLIAEYRNNLVQHDSDAYMYLGTMIYAAEADGLLSVAQAIDLRNKIRDRWYNQ